MAVRRANQYTKSSCAQQKYFSSYVSLPALTATCFEVNTLGEFAPDRSVCSLGEGTEGRGVYLLPLQRHTRETSLSTWLPMPGLGHGFARVAHCVTARLRNFSHYCRPLRQYDVWFTCSGNREALTAAPTAHSVQKHAFRVHHWTSGEASLRHSSGWGTEAFPLSSVICAPVVLGLVYTSSKTSWKKGENII